MLARHALSQVSRPSNPSGKLYIDRVLQALFRSNIGSPWNSAKRRAFLCNISTLKGGGANKSAIISTMDGPFCMKITSLCEHFREHYYAFEGMEGHRYFELQKMEELAVLGCAIGI